MATTEDWSTGKKLAPPREPIQNLNREIENESLVVLLTVVIIACITLGAYMRLWFLFHESITSDSAVVGLIATQILHGHFFAFFWGQPYGGGEPYVVAMMFAIFGKSVLVLRMTPVFLSIAASILMWRLSLRLFSLRILAVLSGAMFFGASSTISWLATLEYGFRWITILSGLVMLLAALRLRDGNHSFWTFGILGASLGIGWWSSPEIVYFVVPSAIYGVMTYRSEKERTRSDWMRKLGLLAATAIVTALPWIWSNIQSNLLSLRLNTAPITPHYLNFFGRLREVFTTMFPILLNSRVLISEHWIQTGQVVYWFIIALLVGATIVCLMERSKLVAPACALIFFPFFKALSPTVFAGDGRYVMFAFVFIVLVFIGAATALGDRIVRAPAHAKTAPKSVPLTLGISAGIVILFLCYAMAIFYPFAKLVDPSSNAILGTWRTPDAPTAQVISDLERDGIHSAFADYWLAYKMDFMGDGKFIASPIEPDTIRSAAIENQVKAAKPTAMLFIQNPTGIPDLQFRYTAKPTYSLDGPGEITIHTAMTRLNAQHIAFHIIKASFVTALVITKPITLSVIGL